MTTDATEKHEKRSQLDANHHEAGGASRIEQIYTERFDFYQRLAMRILRNYTGQTDQADDIVHDAFLLAGKKWESCSEYPEAWIAKTVKFLCLNYTKTYYSRKEIMKATVIPQKRYRTPEAFENISDIMVTLEQQLSLEDFRLFKLYCFEHRSIDEISRETGMTPNAIRVRIFRIRKTMEQIILSMLVIIATSRYIL